MRMGEAGVLDRVQSLLMYDCNQGSIDAIDSDTQSMSRNVRSASLPVILPNFLPKVDGFLRDPNAYKDYYGLIHRDMERMVDTVARRAEEVGSPPQIILEWLGFGGHAKLGGVLHGMLLERFPDALFLPIMLMPREHVLEENMRRETWGAYEETMGLTPPQPSTAAETPTVSRLSSPTTASPGTISGWTTSSPSAWPPWKPECAIASTAAPCPKPSPASAATPTAGSVCG